MKSKIQASDALGTVTQPKCSAMNAFKHGVYTASAVLPGDDPVPFLRHRRALFHTYRPQTKDEADLVAAMAKQRWIADRLGSVQDAYDGQIVAPERDAAGRICEPVAHQRLHSCIDVSIQVKRIETLWHTARSQLMLVQKHRQQGLVAGAMKLPKDCYMDT